MRSSDEIQKEIHERLGFLPAFFTPAIGSPAVLENLWQQTKASDLDSALPAAFRRKLGLLVSRHSNSSYRLISLASELRRSGTKSENIYTLLERPAPGLGDRSQHLEVVPPSERGKMPAPDSFLEETLLDECIAVFLRETTKVRRERLRTLLGEVIYDQLMLFVSYQRVCLDWAESHPELSTDDDPRVREKLMILVQEEPRFKDYFDSYRAKFPTGGHEADVQRENLRNLFFQTPMIVCILSGPTHIYEYVNPGMMKLFGGKDFTGRAIRDVQPEVESADVVQVMDEVYRTGVTSAAKQKPIPIGEALRYFDFVFAARRDRAGEIDGIMVLASDVTDILATKEIALKSEEQLRVITDHLPAFVAYMDSNGQYQFLNKTYERWYGKSTEDMKGLRRHEFAKSETNEIAIPFQRRALAGEKVRYQNIVRDDKGETRYLDVEFVPNLDEKTGKVKGVVVVGHDVTELQEARRQAELSRKELYDLFMDAPVGICVFEGPDHTFSLANPVFTAIFFHDSRTLIGRSVREVVPEGKDQGYHELLDNVYATGKPVYGNEASTKVRQANGDVKETFTNFIYQAKRNARGEIDGVMVVLFDVTDQVLAKQKMEQAVRARDEFLSIASHELKTPLTSIQLQTQMAKRNIERNRDTAFEPARVVKLIDQTDKSLKRLTRLVDDMLDISRITTGKLTFHYEEFDLCELVREVVDGNIGMATPKKADIAIESCEKVIGFWDRFRLEQVVTNLLTNAIRYGEDSPVAITVSQENAQAILRVKDSGPGVAEENKSRIFERFERATPATSISGLGLGLYICKEIVDRHQGSIHVESEIGGGACFVVKLPLKQTSAT